MTFFDFLWLFFVIVPLTLLWIFTLVDVFSRRDLSGGAKALWVIAIFLFPWLGVLAYIIARPPEVAGAFARPEMTSAEYPAAPASVSGELERLSRLKQDGVITTEEYETAKEAVLKKAA